MEESNLFNAFLWIGVVFAAGFIGFFGKYLGKIVLGVFSKKTDNNQTPDPHPDEQLKLKIEKKRLKAAYKAAKKTKE